MEPKSIAFYTAVAVSILAVISATTFPTLVQAQTTPPEEESEAQSATQAEDGTRADNQADDGATTAQPDDDDPQADDEATADKTEPKKDGEHNSANSNDGTDQGGSQSLGLNPGSGVASCGQMVTEDVTLTSDLDCGSGDGLIVGASNVHINLNGYTISSDEESDSTDLAMDYDGNSGILVAGADDVVISGLGSISGFDTAIKFMDSSGGEVTDLTLSDNRVGVLMSGSEGAEISRNTITNNEFAIVSASSNEATIAFNQIVGNLKQGIVLKGSADNVVAANSLYGNGDNGVYVDIQSTGNTIDFDTSYGHDVADINNAGGQPTSVNGNTYGEHNNCGVSLPGGLCG
jgi:parallel beta-helix repeat protein